MAPASGSQNVYLTDDPLAGQVKAFIECWEGQLKGKKKREKRLFSLLCASRVV